MTTQTIKQIESNLPEPSGYYYEWDGPYGKRKFSVAPHNGRQCDRAVAYYTVGRLRAAIAADRAKRIAGPVLTEPEIMQAMLGDDLNKGKGHPFLIGTDDFIKAGRAIESAVLAKLKEQS